MSPEAFATECRKIVTLMRGHDAHRALDFLTNDVLRELGYGEGIAIFEEAVSRWHAEADAYPYTGPCPKCRDTDRSGEADETPKAAQPVGREPGPKASPK